MNAETVISLLIDGVPESYSRLRAVGGGVELSAFALCTDPDFRTLYSAGCRESDRADFPHQHAAMMPAEWSLEDGSGRIREASDALSRWADSNYDNEGDDVHPNDDHRRPWKKAMYFEIVEALLRLRPAVFPPTTAVLFVCHDPSDEMESWMKLAQSRLNPPHLYDEWLAAWRAWVGE